MTLDQINEALTTISHIRQKVNAFIKAAVAAGTLSDALDMAACITRDIATGGKDPAAILATLDKLVQINDDLNTAEAAMKAEQPVG